MKIDLQLFNAINGQAKKSNVLDFFGIFFAKYLAYLLIFLLAVIALKLQNLDIFLLPIAGGCISLVVVNEAIYIFYKRKRPLDLTPDRMLISKPVSPAFPSSHTSFFFALSFTLLLFSTSLGWIFLLSSCLIAVARVFCGVHWPSDILGGIFSATLSFLLLYWIISSV